MTTTVLLRKESNNNAVVMAYRLKEKNVFLYFFPQEDLIAGCVKAFVCLSFTRSPTLG